MFNLAFTLNFIPGPSRRLRKPVGVSFTETQNVSPIGMRPEEAISRFTMENPSIRAQAGIAVFFPLSVTRKVHLLFSRTIYESPVSLLDSQVSHRSPPHYQAPVEAILQLDFRAHQHMHC